MRSEGLRPGGQDPVAELVWRSRRARGGYRSALLYERRLALPVRPMTPARERALARALLARHTCKQCGWVFEYCLPTSTGGLCQPCERADVDRVLCEVGWAV
nr:RRQRL motif-containing zinc-binding protein [Nocardiopsis halophila]